MLYAYISLKAKQLFFITVIVTSQKYAVYLMERTYEIFLLNKLNLMQYKMVDVPLSFIEPLFCLTKF
jgi:hypothetical protein